MKDLKTPDLTVLIPLYNGRLHIADTVESILQQTYTNFELLIIDDGSTDDSVEIINKFRDDRIRIINQNNLGLAEALNTGIRECRTEFIARNDQDDLSFPIRLERQINYLKENPEVGCVFSHYTKFGIKNGWKNADKQTNITESAIRFEGIPHGCQLQSSLLARTEVLRSVGGLRQEYYPSDDWDLELRLVQVTTIHIIQEPLFAYRFHFGANTYARFTEMQDKGAWAEDSYRRRNNGDPELTFDGFLDLRKENFRQKFFRRRLNMAKLHLRLSGQYYLDGLYARSLIHAVISGILNPNEIFYRLMRLLNRKT